MPRKPNSPHNPGCGPMHTHTSASENIKLQMMMAKLEDSLKNEFVLKEQLKTINLESLLGSGNIDIKSIDKIEKASEGLVDTYTIYFINNAEPYSFTVTNGAKGEKGDKGDKGDAGIQGPVGPQGIQGPKGDQGIQGIPGEKGADGAPGKDGVDGTDGQSAYALWLSLGNTGSEQDFINSLKGEAGKDGQNGTNGQDGINGTDGKDGVGIVETKITTDGELIITYTNGTSVNLGKVVGSNGKDGQPGADGAKGEDGTPGLNGTDGKSAYEIWLDLGNIGSEEDFINSLKGESGKDGLNGQDGNDGADGKDGLTTAIQIGETTYEHVDGIINLPETLFNTIIGKNFVTDITVGRLQAGTPITADMSFGDILYRMLVCQHDFEDATCTEAKTCKICGVTEGDPLGHIPVIDEAKAATCTETGLTEGSHCSRCGEILVKQQVIPALGHNYTSEVTLEPTCTTEGTRTYTCNNDCGKTYTETIPALGHDYVSEVIKPATCTEEGLRKHTCTRCGDSYEEVIPKLEHQTATREENRVEPDCTNTGSYEKVTYCTACDEELSRTLITIPALGHDYGDWVITKEPEIEVPGEQTKTCNRCGHVITEEIPALPKPEEPTLLMYRTGPVSEENAFDYPDYWVDMGHDPQERAQHYFDNMTPVEISSWDDLLGQKTYKIAHKLADDTVTGYAGEDTNTYSAIAIDSNYEVVAWSTDAAGSYPATAIRAFEMNNGYTIYYAEDPVPNTTEIEYYITIQQK